MATNEIYIDEHPKTPPGSGWGGGAGGGGGGGGAGGVGGGGGWGDGGGGAGGGGGEEFVPPEYKPEEPWFAVGMWGSDGAFLPLVDGSGVLLMHKGVILQSVAGCLQFVIECQIKDDADGKHVRCIILELVPVKTDDKSLVGGILPHGILKVYARWQKGHYDYSQIAQVRFRLKNQPQSISPWYKLPLDVSSGKPILLLTVNDGIIRIKNFY